MQKLFIIKIGGNVIDDELMLSQFIKDFAAVNDNKILIHGGGKIATALAKKLNIEQHLVDGRRLTNTATLKVITMVFAGLINKTIIAGLQAHNCNALGLTGADANVILSHKKVKESIDYGFVGVVDTVNTQFLQLLLEHRYVPVIAPLTHDGHGQLLNTNADTIAQEIAVHMSKLYEVTLVYCFEKNGVLRNIDEEDSVIRHLNHSSYESLKSSGGIDGGMIPKLDNAFAALNFGIVKVLIGNSAFLQSLISQDAGTLISN